MTEIAENMNIETVTVGAYEVNCYVIWDESLNALVIDPGARSLKSQRTPAALLPGVEELAAVTLN